MSGAPGHLPALAVAGCLAAATAGAAAPDRPHRAEIQLGSTFFDADARFQTVRRQVPDLGFDVDDVGIGHGGARFFASGSWRITDRWLVQFDLFGFDNQGRRSGAVEGPLGALLGDIELAVEGSVDLDLYVLNLGYRLIEHQGFKAGIGAGVHYVSLDYGLTAATLPEQGGVELAAVEGSDRFPAPNLYGWAGWRLTERLQGTLKAGWLGVSSGGFDGRIYFVRTSLQYHLAERVGIGAGFWLTDFDVDRQSSTRLDEYQVRLRGPELHLSFMF